MAKNKRFWSLLLLLFYNNISLAQDFRTFLEKMKMSSSLSKIFKTGINVFIKNKKYYEKSTTYECVDKKIDDNWL